MASAVCLCAIHRLALAGEALRSAPAERPNAVRHVITLLTIVVFCALFMARMAWAQGASAKLVVQVSNGTANGTTVVGDAVTLQVFQHQELRESSEAEVDESGEAVFEEIPTGAHLVAVARVKHHNMAFRGRPVSLASPDGGFSTVVQVFDVSSDPSPLSVGTHHVTIAVEGETLQFTEYMQLQNRSDMAITGSKRDAQDKPIVIEIVLPAGARDLTPSGYFEQSALVTTDTGFYDTLAVPPGEHQIRFSYGLDIDRRTTDIVKEISLPTSEFIVFWEGGRATLTGLGKPDGRLTNAEGVPVEYYQRGNVQAGDRINFQISGFNVKTSDTDTWIVLAVAFAVVFAMALWRLRTGSTTSPPTT